MSVPAYDLVIRNGTISTASDVFATDVGINGETIVALGSNLAPGKTEIDARGKLVLPGGVDAHAHIEQLSAAGIMNADTFETATRSAAFGGTTSVISFAAQHVGMDARQVVSDLRGAAHLHKHPLKSAGFRVLKAPDVPAVLVELGYVSSPGDLKELVSEGWRSRASDAILHAVNTFFATRFAGAHNAMTR